MPTYRERLRVPLTWWLSALACVLLLGSMLWAGFSLTVAAAVYAVLGSLTAALLLNWGAATIEVTAGHLRAGRERLPLGEIGEATALDRGQVRQLLGPRANPAAFLLIRPYLRGAVYVAVAGRPARHPYWLVATRRPAELAAAIERARREIDPAGPREGATLTTRAPQAGAGAASARAAHQGRASDGR